MALTQRTRRILKALVVILVMTAIFVLLGRRKADILYDNGLVHTLDGETRTVEAIAVRDGRILALGSTDEILGHYTAEVTVDLKGAAVIPAFVDGRTHLLNAGILSLTLDVGRAGSAAEAARMVGERAGQMPPGTWIRGRGWVNHWWDEERRSPLELLDQAAPANPVILLGEDGMTAWVNSMALSHAGIPRRPTEHEPATVVRDRGGAPMGILLDDASRAVQSSMPAPTDWELEAALDSAIALCLRSGITAVQDFGLSEREIRIYQKRSDRGALPIGVHAVLGGRGAMWDSLRHRTSDKDVQGQQFRVGGIELYVDGALESYGAALLEPYHDRPESRGMTLADEQEVADLMSQCRTSGFQLCLYTRGDRAVRVALTGIRSALGGSLLEPGAVRLESLELITPEDIAAAKELGITVVMEPANYLLDYDVAGIRLGKGRLGRFLPWAELQASGVRVAGATDLPLGPADPFLAIAMVIGRHQAEAEKDRVVRLGALRMFTSQSAAANRMEAERGSLEVGKLADFLVLSADPFTVDRDSVASISVRQTVLRGRAWHSTTD